MARRRPLRVGFIPLADAAPIIAGVELGIFDQHGLHVELSREMGWASIRDKILYGELDAAHALGAMPLAATLGIGSPKVPCATGFIINSNGNAITISQRHWDGGVRDEADLADYIKRRARAHPLCFGVVFPTSSHHFLMRSWLRQIGVNPDKDVRIVVLPPPQVFRNLAAGTIDGYCVGEPWNSLAVKRRAGWVPITSAELAPRHPEKVVMSRLDFMEGHPEAYGSLVRGLDEAARWCATLENADELARILARPEYLNCEVKALLPGLVGTFDFGNGVTRAVPDFLRFHGEEVNRPDEVKGQWFADGLREAGLLEGVEAAHVQATLRHVYLSDAYDVALAARVPGAI